MLKGLRSLFTGVETTTIPLEFVMDMDENDRHIVEIYKNINGFRSRVDDVGALLSYGYREIDESEDQTVLYTVSDSDRQTLLSLRSLNPTVEQ